MIFNKSKKGSAEVKERIGFIYKSINFDNLKPYMLFAERDLKQIIGKDVFDVAEQHYNGDHYCQETADEDHPEYPVLDEFVSRIQMVVAIQAYRRFVPSNDIAHSDKGRQIFVAEQEKPAFEWQIEKDNENLLAIALEATDVLLEFLDDHIADTVTIKVDGEDDSVGLLIPWANSDEFKIIKGLFVSTIEQFEQVFPINGSRVTFRALIPFLRHVQQNIIKSTFIPEKYTELLNQVLSNSVTDDNKQILDLVRQPMVMFALSMAIKRLSVEVLPDGIFTNITTSVVKSKTASSKEARNEVSTNLEKDAQGMLRMLQEFLRKKAATTSGAEFVPEVTPNIDPKAKYVRL